MPLFNKTFSPGKMNKDMDERIVPNGEYRDAVNIQVQTSDGSNAGAAQTLLGNTKLSSMVPEGSTCVGSIADNKNDKVYYLVAGPEESFNETSGSTYDWNKNAAWKDYIIEYDIKTETFKYVFVDIYRVNYKAIDYNNNPQGYVSGEIKLQPASFVNPYTHIRHGMFVEVYDNNGANYITQHPEGSTVCIPDSIDSVLKLYSTHIDFTDSANHISSGSWLNFSAKRILNFHKDRYITGINIVDGMLFWTDNHSEPKKINIERSIAGTGGYQYLPSVMPGVFEGDTDLFHTRLCVTPDKVNPLTVKLKSSTQPWFTKEENITVIRKAPLSAPALKMSSHEGDRFDANGDLAVTAASTDGSPGQLSGPPAASNNSFSYTATNGFDYLKRVGDEIQGVKVNSDVYWKLGDTILFNQNQDDDVSVGEFTEHDVRCTITGGSGVGSSSTGPFDMMIESIDSEAIDAEQKVWHLRLEKEKPMFEFKFARFAYRYKYEDGEYSTFSPWSEPAFIPGPFDYLPKKAFNLGMTNRLRNLTITNYVVEESLRPQGVVAIDLLYKDESSPNIYTVETIKMTDGWVDKDDTEALLLWPDSVTGTLDVNGVPVVEPNKNHRGEYKVTSELIHATVASNQLLRQWDNVPRKALAQEVTSNRLVYGNYLQNYNLTSDFIGNEIRPKLLVSLFPSETRLNATDIEGEDAIGSVDDETTVNINLNEDNEFVADGVPMPHKTCRSLREYQVGVVYGDEYGRETPVLAGDGSTGSLTIPKMFSSTANRLRVQIASDHPSWAKYFKFFVKETSNEYYNMAMDRWYNAEDGNIWLSFPSADRNKVDEETFIILKKRHDTHQPVDDPARYKIIAIENSAPDFIKTNVKSLGIVYNNTSKNDIGSPTVGFPLLDYEQIWFKDAATGVDELFGIGGNSSASFEGVQQMVNEGTCFIRIRTVTIKSDWYQVTKAVLDGADSRYKFTVDGVFKEDVEFASSNGGFSGAVDDLRIELSNHKVENKKEFEGRFFVKIYKDLVLLQNLLLPAEKKYKVLNASKMGYWNTPKGGRAENAALGAAQADWESWGVNCKGEFDACNSPGYCGGIYYDDRNPGFKVGNASWSDNNRSWFFYTANYGWEPGPNWGTYSCTRERGTRDWYNLSLNFFHIDASWVRSPRKPDYTNCNDNNEGGQRGRGIYEVGGKPTMDIGYCFPGKNADDVCDYIWNETAKEFYDQITTTGTTFRFREDPDGVVYKVTGSKTSGQQTSSPFNNNGHIGYMHTVSDTNARAGVANTKVRFSVSFEDVNQPGTIFNGPSGYNVIGGKPTTKTNGVAELGYWGGVHRDWKWDLGGGADDNDMVVPFPPGYPVYSASCGSGTTYTDVDGNQVKAIDQAKRWRQHPAKFHYIEIVEEITDDDADFSSKNPAIWETEPKEDVGMDIYYEASDAIPIEINASTNELFAPFGTLVNRDYNPFAGEYRVKGWSDNFVTLDNDLPGPLQSGARMRFTRPDGFITTIGISSPVDGNTGQPAIFPNTANDVGTLKLRGWKQAAYPITNAYYNDAPHNQIYTLNWFNAYAFGNGIESDRIRDDFNAATLANGVKASTVLAEQYKEDRRKTGLIHSGIYNSTSGVNQLNQFIAAEKITKDMNPSYGSIQKLHTRDSNIVVLHEDKCMKVLANKDALFNADGSKNVAISSNFLGSDEPFATRYGISTNPESCAADLAGRLYFSDRTRGAVLRLSNDGITNISNYGMKDWFGDNLGPLTQRILGSFDEKKEEYNITIKGLYPVNTSGSGSDKGGQCGCDTNTVSTSQDANDIRSLENTTILRSQSNLNIGSVSVGNLDFYNSEVTLSFSEGAKGWISFKSFVPESGVSINNEYYTFKGGEMYKHHSNLNRNTFYGDHKESSITLLFNDQPSTVKSFSTLNYEGSQARNKANLTDGEYTNLVERDGWYVSDIKTNLQESSYLEFIGKEDKWFTYIKGDTTTLQNLDEREFSVQGVGSYLRMEVVGEEAKQEVCLTITPNINCTPIPGCMDPDADNYNPNANVDDDSCTYPPEPVYGCTDPDANNYDTTATLDDGSCEYDVDDGGGPVMCPWTHLGRATNANWVSTQNTYPNPVALFYTMVAFSRVQYIPSNHDITVPPFYSFVGNPSGNMGTLSNNRRVTGWYITKPQYHGHLDSDTNALFNSYWNITGADAGPSSGWQSPIIKSWNDVISTLNAMGIVSQTLTNNDDWDNLHTIFTNAIGFQPVHGPSINCSHF